MKNNKKKPKRLIDKKPLNLIKIKEKNKKIY